MTILCQGNHADDRTTDPPLNVCRRCRHLSLIAIRTMPQTFRTLGLQLIPTNIHGQPITGTRNPGINLDDRIVNARILIQQYLRGMTAALQTTGRITEPVKHDDLDQLARILTTHHEYSLTLDSAPKYATTAIYLSDHCRKLIEANPVHTYPIGKCPECEGTLIAQMRPMDPLLPAIIICDKSPTNEAGNPAHAWTADRWAALGKIIR